MGLHFLLLGWLHFSVYQTKAEKAGTAANLYILIRELLYSNLDMSPAILSCISQVCLRIHHEIFGAAPRL
jgi:hypothetical protein